MEWLDFIETWGLVIFTYLISTMFFMFLVWGFFGFNKGLNELEGILIIAQFSGLGALIVIPSIIYFISQFEVVRRE